MIISETLYKSHYLYQNLKDVEVTSITTGELLSKTGYFIHDEHGLYYTLPLGVRLMRSLQSYISKSISSLGFEEVTLPYLHPHTVRRISGRSIFDVISLQTKDRNDNGYSLTTSPEEMYIKLLGSFLQVHDKDAKFFQFGKKVRDEFHYTPYLRLLEFHMFDAYAFHRSKNYLDASYNLVQSSLVHLLNELGIKTDIVVSGTNEDGDVTVEELVFRSNFGESHYIRTPKQNYIHLDVASQNRTTHYHNQENQLEPFFISYDDGCHINSNILSYQILVAHGFDNVLSNDSVIAITRGDVIINPRKIEILLGILPDSLQATGTRSLAKFSNSSTTVVGDISITMGGNYYGGLHSKNIDSKNINYPRDFSCDVIGDIGTVDTTEHVKLTGIEIGNTYKFYNEFTKGNNDARLMSAYSLGIERIIWAMVEANRDQNGIVFPNEIVPLHLYLICDHNMDRSLLKEMDFKLSNNGIYAVIDNRECQETIKYKTGEMLGAPYIAILLDKNGLVRINERNMPFQSIISLYSINELLFK